MFKYKSLSPNNTVTFFIFFVFLLFYFPGRGKCVIQQQFTVTVFLLSQIPRYSGMLSPRYSGIWDTWEMALD